MKKTTRGPYHRRRGWLGLREAGQLARATQLGCLLGLSPLLLLQGLGLGLLLLQLLLADLLPLMAGGGPLDHLHGVQVAVGGLAVHGLLDHPLGGVGGLVLLDLLLLPHMLLYRTMGEGGGARRVWHANVFVCLVMRSLIRAFVAVLMAC